MPNITTTGGGNKPMITTTEGGPTASPYSGMDIGDFLGKVLKAKESKSQAPAPRAPMQPMERMRPAEPVYTPQLGQASVPDSLAKIQARPVSTRMRRVRKRTSIPAFMDMAGTTYDDVQEHMLADGTWSGDAIYGRLEDVAKAGEIQQNFNNRGYL